jgi:two-component system CheB/CheR fusion protein
MDAQGAEKDTVSDTAPGSGPQAGGLRASAPPQDGGSLWAAGADLTRILFRGLPDLAWLKDPQGRYLCCNAAFERIVGCTEAELRGRTDVPATRPRR